MIYFFRQIFVFRRPLSTYTRNMAASSKSLASRSPNAQKEEVVIMLTVVDED